METNILNLEKAMKDYYLPSFDNQISTKTSPLLSSIKTVTHNTNKIVASAPMGISGGFGFGAEGQNTPQSGPVAYERFETELKDLYVDVEISHKAVELGNTKAMMIDALNAEMKACYEAAKWNVGRSLFGNGTGKLANIDAQSSASDKIKVDSVQNLKEGLTIDIYASSGTLKETNRIKFINRKPVSGKYTVTLYNTTKSTLAAGFITVQNSYNKELTGIGAIFDNSVASIYGISKALNPILVPETIDAGGYADDIILNNAVRVSEDEHNGSINMFLCGYDAYDAYLEYCRAQNTRVENRIGELKGGFKTIKFMACGREIDIVAEKFVPKGEIWGVNTNDITLYQSGWKFANLRGGGIFNLAENRSVYRGLLANYANVICQNPGACVRITNCSDYTATA